MLGVVRGMFRHDLAETVEQRGVHRATKRPVLLTVVRVPGRRCRPSYPLSDFTCCGVRCTSFFGLQFQIDWVGCVRALS